MRPDKDDVGLSVLGSPGVFPNLARDLGTRIVAAIFFGRETFSYLNYSWIAILVIVPATLFATGNYEFLMRDSLSTTWEWHAVHEDGEERLQRYITNTVNSFHLCSTGD